MKHDAEKKTNKQFLIKGETPGVTDDTTNKGLRPRNPPTNPGGRRRLTIDSSGFKLTSSTPLTRDADSGETKLEGVRVTH